MSQTPRTSLACAHTVALQAKRLAAGAWEAKGARMHQKEIDRQSADPARTVYEYVTRRHHVRTTPIRIVDPGMGSAAAMVVVERGLVSLTSSRFPHSLGFEKTHAFALRPLCLVVAACSDP